MCVETLCKPGQYCLGINPGAPTDAGAGPFFSCADLPSQCVRDPTCACVEEAGICGDVQNGGGGIECQWPGVLCNYP